tara:strand:+ start:2903 stop:5533 length:2631 start_codon:yes stop_codon:yes gene_type:complete
MAVPIAGLLSGTSKIVGAARPSGSGAKLAGSIVKREPKKSQDNSLSTEKNGSALAIRPKQGIVPYENVETLHPTPIGNENEIREEDKLTIIHKKVWKIFGILNKNFLANQEARRQRNRQEELEEEKKREEKLEKKDEKKKPDKNKLNLPKMGIFGAVGNFITNVVLGFILMRLIDHAPKLEGIIKGIASAIEWTSNFVIGFVDGLGSFLSAGLRAYQWAENYLQKNSGEEAVERFHGLTKQLTNLFNAFLIVGSVFAALGRNPITGKSPGAKKKLLQKASKLKAQKKLLKGTSKEAIERYTKRFGADAAKKKFGSAGQAAANRLGLGKSQIMKGGLGRTTTRFVGKTLGPKAMKAIGPVIKKLGAGFSRVPVVGSLIVAVSSLLAGEPLGQAAFKGLGAALGGFAGSFIPIPVVGTLIGSTIGTFIGDVLYTLILEKDPKAAGEKFMKGLTDSVKMLFDFAGMAAQFVKEGFGRLIKNFPTIDIPPRFGLQTALGKVAELFGVEDDSKFMEDGRIVKLPNLALLTPMGLPFLVPHIASSFLPDIFGKGGVMNSIFGENGTAWGGSGESIDGDTGGNQPELRGNDEGGTNIPDGDGQTSASGTSNRGMITGPAGYDRIGAGAAYHVDTKFHKSLGMGGMISAMDKLADAYAARGREIVFSGQGYARLKAYKSDLDPKEKKALLQSAIDAHSHSTFMRAEGFLPFDYYIPATGIRDLYHPSTEKAEILLPDFGGTTKVGALYGGYGKSANIFDSSGKHVAMTGHGDLAYAEGGETLATPHMALIGEEGKEFVIDADSFAALQGKYPGFLAALNRAEGLKSIEVLENYASYENAQTQVIIIEKEPEEPVEESGGSGMRQFMTSVGQKMEDFTEFLVGQG